jgi:hypothetical protein
VRLKKNGGAWAQKAAAQTLTHEENGNYEVTLDATDTDTIGLLRLHVHESGALPVWEDFHVLAANVYDSIFGAATDKLQVDLVEIGGVAQSATDLKDFADDGYDPSTNKVQGVVTVDTVTATLASNIVSILGTAVTQGAAGRLAGAFSTLFDVAAPALTAASVNQTGDNFARIGALGAGLTALAPSATALSTATWTTARAGYLDNINVGAVASAANLATVDTNVDSILADTGTDGVVVASGSKTGYALASTGLDAIVVESGINARQALSGILASAAGVLSGASTSTVVIKGGDVATTRITATCDQDGNRTAVTLNLPA